MWGKILFCVLLAASCTLQCEAAVYRERRTVSLPQINLLNIPGTVASFQNFTKDLVGELTQLAENAISAGQNAQNTVQSFAQAIIGQARTDVQSLLNGTIVTLQERLRNGPVAKTISGAECLAAAVGASTFSAANATQQAIACTTDQVGSIVGAGQSLIVTGTQALFIGSEVYNNFTSCFPNGFTIGLDTLGNLMCTIGKIGPMMTDIGSTISTLINDVTTIQTGVANFRNSVVRCPREKMADLVVNFGNIVTSYGSCLDNVIAASSSNDSSSN